MGGYHSDCLWVQYPYPTKPLDLAVKFGYLGSKLNANELLNMDEARARVGSLVFELIKSKEKDIKSVYSAHIKILELLRDYFPKWYVFTIIVDNSRAAHKSLGLFEFEWYCPSLGDVYLSKIVRFETILLATLYANLNFNVGTMAAELGLPYKDYYYASYRLYMHVVSVQVSCWPLRDERALPFEATTQGAEFGRLLCLVILQNKSLEVAKTNLHAARTKDVQGKMQKWLTLSMRLAIWLYFACMEFDRIYVARLKDYKALHSSYRHLGSKIKLYAAYLIFILSAIEMEVLAKYPNCMVFVDAILHQKNIEGTDQSTTQMNSIKLFEIIGKKVSMRDSQLPFIRKENGPTSAEPFSIVEIHKEAERMKRTNDNVWYAIAKNADSSSPWALVTERSGTFFKIDNMEDLNHLGFTETELTDVHNLLRK